MTINLTVPMLRSSGLSIHRPSADSKAKKRKSTNSFMDDDPKQTRIVKSRGVPSS